MNMGDELNKKDSPITLSQIMFLLPLVVLLVGLVMYIGSLQSSVKSANDNINDMKQDIREINKKTTSMSEDIVAIKTTLGIRATNQAGASAILSPTPILAKMDLPAPAPNYQQSQTVIAQIPSPTPTPFSQPTPAPTPTLTSAINNIVPSISVLGVPLLERR